MPVTLLVGERMNLPRRDRDDWRDPASWYGSSLLIGAFHDVRSRAKLDRLGVDLDAGETVAMNLTPPGPQGWPWDAEAAAAVARLAEADPRWGRLLLCGRRVAAAFGHRTARVWGSTLGRLTFLPHPSGLCRFWNDPSAVEACRELLAEGLSSAIMTEKGR